MDNKLKIAVIGGDLRQVSLAGLFVADGHDVTVCGLDAGDLPERAVGIDAAAECGIIILPIVPVVDGIFINTPRAAEKIYIQELLGAIPCGRLVIAGGFSDAFREQAAANGLGLASYLDREDFAAGNAVLTAEGAIQVAMEVTDHAIFDSNCMIAGFGRIGKLLAFRLNALGAHVTVSARCTGDLAWIRVFGYTPVETGKWGKALEKADIVFNTIPCRVFAQSDAAGFKRGMVYIELASAPGGMNLDMAERMGIRAVCAPSLPGKVAPLSAALLLHDTITQIIKEKEGYT